jgi:hypothetical protein
MTATRAPGRATLLAVVALLGAAVAVPATPAAAGCGAVRAGGPWTVADYPPPSDAPSAHALAAFGVSRVATTGPRSRAYVSQGERILRTDDMGCTWHQVYSIGTDAAAAVTGDAGRAFALAHAQYSIAGLSTRLAAPGARPPAGKDPVYAVMANTDGFFTGLAQNLAGVWPHFVARSLDGGATWQTSVLEAKLEGAPVATPVTGDGLLPVQVVVSPADPRTAYLAIDTRDPRAIGTTALDDGGLYATRDGGATWSFVVPNSVWRTVVPDPADPATAYTFAGTTLDAVTAGAAPKRTTLLTVGKAEALEGFDVIHAPHRAATLLATSTYVDEALQVRKHVVYRSADSGRHWLRIPITTSLASVGPGGAASDPFAGGGAWLTASGDLVAMKSAGAYAAWTTLLYRWDARRGWVRPRVLRPPLSPGYTSFALSGLMPLDPAHRYFAFVGRQAGKGGQVLVLGVYDSAR